MNTEHTHDLHFEPGGLVESGTKMAVATTQSGDLPVGPEAVARGEAGTAAWEDVVRLQRWAVAEHADFYALAGLVVGTLYALEDLTSVLERQVAGYPQTQQAHGHRLYDDTRQVDPAERLRVAVGALRKVHDSVISAADWANRFWTAIGHIGAEDTRLPSSTESHNNGTAAAGSVAEPSAVSEGGAGVGGAW